jgi:hypothetical protein
VAVKALVKQEQGLIKQRERPPSSLPPRSLSR